MVFMLWGAHAQSKQALIPAGKGHLVLFANHPSPLSALRREAVYWLRAFQYCNLPCRRAWPVIVITVAPPINRR